MSSMLFYRNLKTVKNVDIFKKKYFKYLLLQQEHYYIYLSIPYNTCCVSVCVVGMEVTIYTYNLLTFVFL